MKLLQIVGRKKSGKTGLLVRLIPLLQGRGLRVGSVKHSSHPHPLDREGSDSWLHRKAGAQKTLAISAVAGSLHFSLPEDEQDIQGLIDNTLGDLDLVLVEGWTQLAGPKIEVLPADKQGHLREPRVKAAGESLAVVISPGLKPERDELKRLGLRLERGAGETAAVPCFLWHEVAAVAELIMRWYESD